MKSYFSVLLLLMYWNSFSQKDSSALYRMYSVKEAHSDIDYTEKYLSKFHPDPYRYISKDSLHFVVNQIKSNIDKPLSELQLRFYIREIVHKIGCGHTEVLASKKYLKVNKKTNRPTLPFNVFMADSNRVFVLNNLSKDSTIQSSEEILSINKVPIPEILNKIYSICSTDGYNQTGPKQAIRYHWFKYYYSFCYGYMPEYEVEIKHSNLNSSIHHLKAGSSLKDTLILPSKDSVIYLRKRKHFNYSVIKNRNSVALLDVNAFSGTGWRKFLRKTFRDLKRDSIQQLVIDLRDNGGGRIGAGLDLLAYFNRQTIRMPLDRKSNLMAFNPKYKMNLATRLLPIFAFPFIPQSFKGWKLRHYFFAKSKKRNAFNGKVYVLVNGKSFSMSSAVATYLKYNSNAVIIGEEVGGNIAGSNAVIGGKIKLPYSKVRVYIPMYHLYHNLPVKNNGHGLMPDYPIHYTISDFIMGKDLELKKVLELIQ